MLRCQPAQSADSGRKQIAPAICAKGACVARDDPPNRRPTAFFTARKEGTAVCPLRNAGEHCPRGDSHWPIARLWREILSTFLVRFPDKTR